jgi:hypothetical protein
MSERTVVDKVAALRAIVDHATNLSEPWDYFYDHLAIDDGFLGASEPARCPALEMLVPTMIAKVLGGSEHAVALMLLHYRELDLWHGAFVAGSHVGSVLAFSPLGKGILMLTHPKSDMTHNMRFRLDDGTRRASAEQTASGN